MTQPEVTTTHEWVTPEHAQKMLDDNKLNRPTREWHIKQLLTDMNAGRWEENGEAGVTFDTNGDIAGGQHTLIALTRSGKTLRLRITRGVKPGARSTMNDSLHQQFSDDLGVAGVTNAAASEALLRKIVVWERIAKTNKGAGGLMGWKKNRLSRSYLAGEWPTYAVGITNTIQNSMSWRDPWGDVGNRGAMQMFWWIATEKHAYPQTIVEEFFNRVVYGSQNPDDKILFQKLRVKLHDDLYAPKQIWWLIRVWNAWVDNEKLTKLQGPAGAIFTDPFPKLRRPR